MPARKTKIIGPVNLVSVIEASKHVPVGRNALYRWLNQKPCPVKQYKPCGRKQPLYNLTEIKREIANSY